MRSIIIIAMVQLAKALDMRVTAKGVETEEQRHFLAEIACNQLQGYLLGVLETADRFADRLFEERRQAAWKILRPGSEE